MTQSNNLYRFVKYDPAKPPTHYEGYFIRKIDHDGGYYAQWDGVRKRFLNLMAFGYEGAAPEEIEYLEPLPIPSSIEEEARKYADGNGFKIDPNDEMGESQASHKYIVDAFIAGSQLLPDTSRLRKALEKIAKPLRYLQEEAKAQGAKLDGQMAIRLSNDANWLKQLAEEELKALNTSGEDKQDEWFEVKKDGYPDKNLGVIVLIPEEDFHITSGMWDVDNKWVLLDEYRVPDSEVTHWKHMPELPEPYANQQKENAKVMGYLSKLLKDGHIKK